jgi:sec-independent protein translocase protein TatA
MGLDNPLHIAFLLILLLLVFGAKRLPEMGRSLGGGLRGFKASLNGEGEEHAESRHEGTALVAPAVPVAAPAATEAATTRTPAPERHATAA